MSFEVEQPIINSPYSEPDKYWFIQPGETPVTRDGRRPSFVFRPREQRAEWDLSDGTLAPLLEYERAYEMVLVNLLRDRVGSWREQGYPGVTRTTLELLRWWRRPEREQRLFFAQLEAAETIIFLKEARADLLQGVTVPREDIGNEMRERGLEPFTRYACKMATGGGKTTVMGMLAAWSILNKVTDRQDARYSDVVLVVCPNITIRDRLRELDPTSGEGSLYRTRDLVPPELLPLLNRGRVLVTNWHVFEPQGAQQVGGQSSKVVKAGVARDDIEIIHFGDKNTTARGRKYLTREEFQKRADAQIFTVLSDTKDDAGNIVGAQVFYRRYVESDSALIERALGKDIGKKQNLLVMNDEAHHAYRISQSTEEESDDESLLGTAQEDDVIAKEATVWVEGLDRIHSHRRINFCIDLSATPYFLARAGRDTARPFPWTVSDFGLIDAIESGLVKIPQLAASDTTGAERAKYFNIWGWVMDKLSPSERGKKGQAGPQPAAVLKYAAQPIAMLAGQWREELARWQQREDPRPPVFIIVCKDIKLAKFIYDWIALGQQPTGLGSLGIAELRNDGDTINTIRVDTKVVDESEVEGSKGDEVRWMRFTLDTVGKLDWPRDRQGRAIYPTGFEELAKKLERPLSPPGRTVRCIVSVGMLTEGWDANTVTHIIGLRPFMSQLLCEQVVGRGLRRASYDVGEDGLFQEEIAQVFGVPFEVIPFKATGGTVVPPPKRFHVHALPSRAEHEIRFPRVEGYTQGVRNRVTVDWDKMPKLVLKPGDLPTIVATKALSVDSTGKAAPVGPGRAREVTMDPFRAMQRVQKGVFEMAAALTRSYIGRDNTVPPHMLFPQLRAIVDRFVRNHVDVPGGSKIVDVFLPPYHGWAVEMLVSAIRPDTLAGEAPELPRCDQQEPEGSTESVDFWTSKDVKAAEKSHVNYVVADTKQWEQQAAFYIDRHKAVHSFVKNAGLRFTIPYLHNGQGHDFNPDFLIRLHGDPAVHLILETKGYDELAEVKEAAAVRWVNAVNADGRWGRWEFRMARKMEDVSQIISDIAPMPTGRARAS